MLFQDRYDAGRQLAAKLQRFRDRPDTIVLALPRGGVPVAWEVARALRLPLDIFLVRKLGVPGHEELAMGAMTSDGTCVFNPDVLYEFNISQEAVDQAIEQARVELQRRELELRSGRPLPALAGETVILIDDGLATGATMRAAVRALNPVAREIIVAAPVAAVETCEDLRQEADQLVVIETPDPFNAVGAFYGDFRQTTDDEVRSLMAKQKLT